MLSITSGARKILFVISLLGANLFLQITGFSQVSLFSLNIKNGLPSNHVYRVLSDRHGYLWIATTKGVVKYNGYDTKIFDATTRDIPNDDIWDLFEDNRGRIWLSAISSEFGYILNDQYHKVTFKNDPFYIYPDYIKSYKDGISFLLGDRKQIRLFCVERNDTVQTLLTIKNNPAIGTAEWIFTWKPDAMAVWKSNGEVFETKFHNGKIKHKRIGSFLPFLENCTLYGNYIIQRETIPSKPRRAFDLRSGNQIELPFIQDENRTTVLYYKSNYYSVTNKCMYKFDSNFNLIDKIYNTDLKVPASIHPRYTMYTDEDIWGKCFCTSNAGLFINTGKACFRKSSIPLAGYVQVGCLTDNTHYYWNAEMRNLLLYQHGNVTTRHYPEIASVNKILNTPNGHAVLLSYDDVYSILNNQLKPFYRQPNLYQKITDSLVQLPSNVKVRLHDGYFDNDGSLKGIIAGYSFIKIQEKKDTVLLTYTDSSRYNNIVRYKSPAFHIAYGDNTILIDNGTAQLKIDNSILQQAGIKNIKKILADTVYGNIFIHCSNKLLAYNIFTHRLKPLFSNYNLNNATVHLLADKLVVVGRFGVAYATIQGLGQFSPVYTTVNYKNSHYAEINNASVIDSTIYLDTDMGMYEITINESTLKEFSRNFNPHYALHAASKLYNNNIVTGDTIIIAQDDPNIVFDFINPYGSGTVRYQYKIDNVVNKIHSNDPKFSFAGISPGIYYKLRVTVYDDLWRSKPYIVYVYAIPYWWQTRVGKNWILILSIIGLGLLSVSIALGTKHFLTKKHIRQSRNREIELKSIYGQLNPHFIFNTLTNIIYFIQKDMNKEAHRHLNAFAKLLRAYIKSSRNRLLSIAEELENMNNYILLQQSRFEDKFDYALLVDENVDINSTFIPSLLLQPIVENAIQHGLQQKEGCGKLIVNFNKTKDQPDILVITIDDDGIGRAKARLQQATSLNKTESYGNDIVKDLVAIFDGYGFFKIDIQYIDKTEPLTGTTVVITIKYKS